VAKSKFLQDFKAFTMKVNVVTMAVSASINDVNFKNLKMATKRI
jgi:large-conductance mechanosensitive channel